MVLVEEHQCGREMELIMLQYQQQEMQQTLVIYHHKTSSGTACSNAVRGVIAGGNTILDNVINVIQFVTIATLGNAEDFGDLNHISAGFSGGCASHSWCICMEDILHLSRCY